MLVFKKLGGALKVPHMGWNNINVENNNIIINNQLDEEHRFYFVHSYFVKCKNKKNSVGSTFYGQNFTSIVNKENIFGVQFHPEKSHKFGMQLFKNFLSV